MTVHPEVRRYMSELGKKGGRVSGRMTGACKRRPREHYLEMNRRHDPLYREISDIIDRIVP